jgi:hypothetical protein
MRLVARGLGFAFPTIALVLALHLKNEMSAGEALDGLVSGIAFTLPFVGTSAWRSRLEGHRASARARGTGMDFLLGTFAALVAWAALWVGWSLPALQAQRANAFWWNCAIMAIAGLLLPPAGRGEPDSDEATLETPVALS